MSERGLTKRDAIRYAKGYLGRRKNFMQVIKLPIRARRPQRVHLPDMDTLLDISVPLTALYIVDEKAEIYMGYCEQLDILIYYPVIYFRELPEATA